MHIVITGANRGIGHGLYTHYREAGHDVSGTARTAPGYLPLDVTDTVQHRELARTLVDKPVDLLICNAGVYLDKTETLDDGYPADMWSQSFAANTTGVFLTIQALLPNLRAAKGKIAIISSQMASHTRAPGGSYIYRASKAAALSLGRNLSTDLKSEGIAVGIYHPGWVQTDMGGPTAAITTDDAINGLTARFAALSLGNTGCFETYDGQDHAY